MEMTEDLTRTIGDLKGENKALKERKKGNWRKPGSHVSERIRTRGKRDISSEIYKGKTRSFLRFVFCSAHGLCFDYGLMGV